MCQTDEHCIAECLNGRPDVFRFLVVRYERPLLGYLTRRMGDPDAAAEVTQESFVRAYFRLGTLKKDDAFFAWLLGIAERVMLETFRRKRPQHSLSEVADRSAPAPNAATEGDAELAEAVARLPAVYREVTVMRYFGGLSCAEVSERLGVPLGTVTKRLSRAYAQLRESLAPPERRSNEVRR